MAHTFKTLLEGIYSSVIEARGFVNDQHIKLFESYFEYREIKDPDTGETTHAYLPRLIPVATSKGAGENETFDIIDTPVIALVPLNTLTIDTLEIEFETKLTDLDVVAAEDAAAEAQETGEPHPQAMRRGLIRRTIDEFLGTAAEVKIMPKGDGFESGASPAKIKIAFKMTNPPEGVSLIQEQMLDYIRE